MGKRLQVIAGAATLLLSAGAWAQPAPPVSASPASVLFPNVPIGSSAIQQVILLDLGLSDDHSVTVTFEDSKGAAFSVTTALPLNIPYKGAAVLRMSAVPSSVDYSGTAVIQSSINGATPLRVPLRGAGLCTDPLAQKCDPTGAVCVVDANAYPLVSVTNPNLFADTEPAIRDHRRAHEGNPASYELPLAVLWRVAGLSSLFGKAPAVCAVAPLKFTHFGATKLVATFEWSDDPKSPYPDLVGAIPNGTVTLAMPDKLQGWSLVFGNRSEFHFTVGAAPNVLLEKDGAVWFDGDLECVGTGSSIAVLRNRAFDASDLNPPKLHLIVE